ncbi:MAG: hypothetical protein AAFW01_00010 [Pseudomonadota bacterium]
MPKLHRYRIHVNLRAMGPQITAESSAPLDRLLEMMRTDKTYQLTRIMTGDGGREIRKDIALRGRVIDAIEPIGDDD